MNFFVVKKRVRVLGLEEAAVVPAACYLKGTGTLLNS